MFGWGRRASPTADAEESDDVNLLAADELSNAAALGGVPQTTPDGPPPPLLISPTDDPPPPVVHVQDRDSGGSPAAAVRAGDGRGRHRSGRRHRHHSRHRLCRCKRKEGNFLTAISCMFVVVLVCTSLAEPHWFYLIGGKCVDYAGQPVNYLGVKLFFYPGYFNMAHASTVQTVYHYGSADNEVLIDCVTPSLVLTMTIIIALCALVVVFSLVAFVLHLLGSSHRILRMLRVNAIFSIVSVLICIIINGLSYLAVEQMTHYFQINPFREGSRVDVEFSLGFYMITAAGVVSILGVACNLLRRTASHSRREHRDQMPFRPPPPADLHQSFCSQLAPPPYTP